MPRLPSAAVLPTRTGTFRAPGRLLACPAEPQPCCSAAPRLTPPTGKTLLPGSLLPKPLRSRSPRARTTTRSTIATWSSPNKPAGCCSSAIPRPTRRPPLWSVLRGSFHDPDDYLGARPLPRAHALHRHGEIPGSRRLSAVTSPPTAAGPTRTPPPSTRIISSRCSPSIFRGRWTGSLSFSSARCSTPAYVEREKNAVHSEYQLQIKDDGWRSSAVVKSAMADDLRRLALQHR